MIVYTPRRETNMKPETSSKFLAFLSYLLFFFGIAPLIIWIFKRKDAFINIHTKQSAYLFYLWLGVNLFTAPLKVFYKGTIFGLLVAKLSLFISVILLILWINLMINSLRGKNNSTFEKLVNKKYASILLLALIIFGFIWIMIIRGIN